MRQPSIPLTIIAAAFLCAAAPAADNNLAVMERSAAKGDPEAQFVLAVNHLDGDGSVVPKDEAKGLALLQKVAERDYAVAQYYLADVYNRRKKDEARALPWYEKAAEQGNYEAQRSAAIIRFPVTGNPSADAEKAYFWITLRLLAGGEKADARDEREELIAKIPPERLSVLDERLRAWEPRKGLGWKDQMKQGLLVKYPSFPALERAAAGGDPWAQVELGIHYRNGFVLPHDEAKAFGWFKRAAEQGDAAGAEWLSACYGGGRGTEKNAREAFFWITVAADDAKKKGRYGEMLDAEYSLASKQVSSEDAVEIDRRVRAWKPKPEGKAAPKKAASR